MTNLEKGGEIFSISKDPKDFDCFQNVTYLLEKRVSQPQEVHKIE